MSCQPHRLREIHHAHAAQVFAADDGHGRGNIHQPLVLTEFGGISSSSTPGEWGYVHVGSAQQLRDRYRTLLETVHGLQLFAGFCYTQFADTYQEANGLLYADRTPKIPLAQIAGATCGAWTRTDGLEQIHSHSPETETRG